MASSQVTDLRQLLERAGEIVDTLDDRSGATVPVDERPGYFDPEPGNDLSEAVARMASAAGPITFVVGAGASMEAGLPSWISLVRGIVDDVAPALGPKERAAWHESIASSGPLAAAAIGRALCSDEGKFRELIWKRLYKGGPPSDYFPGPISKEIANFANRFSDEVRLVTFNYDDLLERSLSSLGLKVQSRVDDRRPPSGTIAVRHLHGRLDRPGRTDPLVLTEVDYARFESSWQDNVMKEALDGLCVFVGLSFSDPNLLRWMYRGGTEKHLAFLTRQGDPRLGPAVRGELETATRARLSQAGIDVYWADFYGEHAQVIHEACRRRGPGRPPDAFATRAARVAERGRRRCVPRSTRFKGRQIAVRSILVALLDIVGSLADAGGVDVRDEDLGLGLWGVDHPQREMSLWASSDRLYADPQSIVPVPFEYASRWAAIEAATRCNVVERDPEVYASRWRFVRGSPLIWRGGTHDRIVVGATTLTSQTPKNDSALAALTEPYKRQIDEELATRLLKLWT